MDQCIICDKDANLSKDKDTKVYEVVLQINNKSLYLHNSCFLDLSTVIKGLHQSYTDAIVTMLKEKNDKTDKS